METSCDSIKAKFGKNVIIWFNVYLVWRDCIVYGHAKNTTVKGIVFDEIPVLTIELPLWRCRVAKSMPNEFDGFYDMLYRSSLDYEFKSHCAIEAFSRERTDKMTRCRLWMIRREILSILSHGVKGQWQLLHPVYKTFWQIKTSVLVEFIGRLWMIRAGTLEGQLWHSTCEPLCAGYRLQFLLDRFETSHISYWEEKPY